ncbi:MAG TPA: hypothetical protein VF590_27045, partial [Isosphaeraceae bacterium]
RSATYDPLARTVTLVFTRPIGRDVVFRLVIDGASRRGLTDSRGRRLDGNGDGRPGGNFVARFGPQRSRRPSPDRVSARAVDELLQVEGLSNLSRAATF